MQVALRAQYLDNAWCVTWPEACEDRVDTILRCPGLKAGAVVWFTQDAPTRFGLWTICQQFRRFTYLEQLRYGRNPAPKIWGDDLTRFRQPEAEYHWSACLPGYLGLSFIKGLRRVGVWRVTTPPVGAEEIIDGSGTVVFAWHPRWGRCEAQMWSGDIFAGNIWASSLEGKIHSWCERSPEAFGRAAHWYRWVGWLWDLCRDALWVEGGKASQALQPTATRPSVVAGFRLSERVAAADLVR